MAKNLVVVESPAKAKTIEKYLGKDFVVMASYGHVRDLVPKSGAVDTEHDFAMRYQTIEKNAKHVEALARALKKAEALYLATDPDREGEAISWHVLELMKAKGVLKDKPVHRVVFHEITRTAVRAAVDSPREISMPLVDAQQARRVLDYLVGFNLSPLLWKKVRRGLSAGRVQSPALRLIVEREEAIEAFKKEEYWTIEADAEVDERPVLARLVEYQSKKVEQFSITTEKAAEAARKALLDAADGKLLVESVKKKQRKRNPAPPFITSTLQQEAARKLGFTARRTMQTAQQLYEGVSIEEGSVGLISYMRTDSVNLAQEAIEEIRALITARYGKENLPEAPRVYKTKAKNAQEAHEAIRPTSAMRAPEDLKSFLSKDQLGLYTLIWKRSVACQMIHATIDTVAVELSCGPGNCFRANGSTITNPGFIAVYQEGMDDVKKGDGDEKMLPPMEEGMVLDLLAIRGEQHFTEPPPRFTEASLVKTLEEYGIGRPSTYASIISTLQHREYVILDSKRFAPTDVGRVVNRFLTKYFKQYVDYNFTAGLEDELDAVARGEKQWVPLLRDFWIPFIKLIQTTEKNVDRKDVTQEAMDEACPKCGKPLSIRLGKRGRFVGCTGFPECDYTRNVGDDSGESTEPEAIEGRVCPECSSVLHIKSGRYGKFIGCSAYPKCRHIESLEKPKDTGVRCPQCAKGDLVLRKTRRGKVFYSCERYPDCDYALWYEPIDEMCPKCAWPILMKKTTKRHGEQKVCPQKQCGYVE